MKFITDFLYSILFLFYLIVIFIGLGGAFLILLPVLLIHKLFTDEEVHGKKN